MPLLFPLFAALAFLGRHGTIVVALSILVGLAVPPLAAAFKPWLGEAIFVMLLLAFLRVDPTELRALVRRPLLIVAATVWVMLVLPAVCAALFLWAGINTALPGLYFILVLQACGPALMSAPALAALIGVDVALTLAALVLTAAVVPFTATFFTHVFASGGTLEPLALGTKLFLFIAGAAVLATIVRWLAGARRIEENRETIDGLSVLAMFIFAAAAMEGVAAHTLADPKLVAALTALTFTLTLVTMMLTTLIFLPAGRDRALAVGILAGNRNIGLMLAATGFAVPDIAWLYFGLAQFPIYLLPVLLKPLAKRLQQTATSP